MGIAQDGDRKAGFTRGMELRGKYMLFAEGARGSLTKQLVARFGLDAGRDPQKYGIGLKELWQVAPEKHGPASCSTRSAGRSTTSTGGGSFLYHMEDASSRSASSSISTTRIRRSRRSTSSSASRRIR